MSSSQVLSVSTTAFQTTIPFMDLIPKRQLKRRLHCGSNQEKLLNGIAIVRNGFMNEQK